MADKGFKVEVTSRYEGWWRYNVAMMAGCFDASEQRVGFATASSHVADPGADLREAPPGIEPGRKAVLTSGPCDHLLLYLYLVPHTLPRTDGIDETQPFEIEITVCCDGRRIEKLRRTINQWSGASIELKIEKK